MITNVAQHAFTSFAQDRRTGAKLSDAARRGHQVARRGIGDRKASALGRWLLHTFDQTLIKLAGSLLVATSVLKCDGGRDSGNR